MEKFKKILTITTIVFTILSALLLILLLFKVTNHYLTSILITSGAIAVGGFFAINSANSVSKSKVIGWVSFALICLSVLLIIIMSWQRDINLNSLYIKITICFSILSVIFNIIVSFILNLGKGLMPFQITLYVITAILYIIAVFQIFGMIPKGNGQGTTWYLVVLIIDVAGLFLLKIFSKRIVKSSGKNTITISKEEYDVLIDKAKKYDELNLNNK